MPKKLKVAAANVRQQGCNETSNTPSFVTADTLLSETEDIEVTRKSKKKHAPHVNTSRGRHTIQSKPSNNPNPQEKSQNTSKKSPEPRTTANNRETATPPKISRLSIVNDLQSGLHLSQIAEKWGVAESTIGYHVKILKNQGVIRMVGYGTWEILKPLESTKKTTARQPYVGKRQPREEIQKNLYEYIPESIRGHAFVWTVQVPQNMRNWSNKKREQYLNTRDPPIPYKSLGIFGGGQSLLIKGHKVWLTNKSIVVYDTDSYFAETAVAAKSTAVDSLISIIRNLERLLHTDFTMGNGWKFKPSRHHYAIIKSALARQYDKEGKKLEVRSPDDNSLWMWIDNSYKMHETENGHKDTAEDDNRKVQNLLNSVRDTGETMHSVRDIKDTQTSLIEAMTGLLKIQTTSVTDQAAFAADLKTHVEVQKMTMEVQKTTDEVLKLIASSVQDLTAAAQEMTKAAKRGNGKQ